MNKKKIKKLAKKSLKKKWYPLRDGDDDVMISDECAFCRAADIRCGGCYIYEEYPELCEEMLIIEKIDAVINILEQLAKYGELRK